MMRTPDFREMPNLEYLVLSRCDSLEKVDDSLGYCRKLIGLDLRYCGRLKRFPCVNVESLEFLDLRDCLSLEKFPEIRGRMKPELKITMNNSGIRELPSSYFKSGTHLTKLDLSFTKQLVALPRGIGMLKSLVELDVSSCSKLESLPEEIGDLENLEKLYARYTLISRPPPSIARLNKLKFLRFRKLKDEICLVEGLEDEVFFVFPLVNDGLRSLEYLDLGYCNLIDGGLPEDLGCLSSLKKLYLNRNNFEHLPLRIAQLGALQSLDLSDCKRLKKLPDFMGMPNLKYLNLVSCDDLEEVDASLRDCGKLLRLYLGGCKSLKRFPCVNVESLEFLDLRDCFSLKKFPKIRGRMKPKLKIEMKGSGIRELPSSYFQSRFDKALDLSFMKRLVALPRGIGMLKSLVKLDVSSCSKLESLPEEIGDLENLEKLDASCTLISPPPSSIARLNKLKFLSFRKRKSKVGLEDRVCFVFPPVNDGLRSLEYLDLGYCNLIDGGLPKDIGSLSSLKMLYLNGNNFENLPRSIAKLGALQSLNLSNCKRLKKLPDFTGMPNLEYLNLGNCDNLEEVDYSLGYCGKLTVSSCSKLESLPEEIWDLENLEKLDASCTLISPPPSSIARLNKLKFLSFRKRKSKVGLEDGVCFVFPRVNGGLCSLEYLNLGYCNLIDGGLPKDIGSLSSLKMLYLNGNNFENLPRSIAQLGALRILDVSDCMNLTQLPEFPQQLDTIYADWSNDWICNSLFQNISSLQHDISASDSLRVFTSRMNIPSWFQHWGIDRSVSVKLPENWYVSDNFLGFAVCYSGSLIETTTQLIPLCDDGMSWMTQKLALSNHSKYGIQFFVPNIQFFLVPLAGLWDTSKANGKTPNDYGLIRLFFSGEVKNFGLRLLYKDEPKLGKRQSRYDDSETSSSSSKKQRSHYNISGSSVIENMQQQVEAPVSSETLQLFPTSSGV